MQPNVRGAWDESARKATLAKIVRDAAHEEMLDSRWWTVTVITNEGRQWNVWPGLLRETAPEKQPTRNANIILLGQR